MHLHTPLAYSLVPASHPAAPRHLPTMPRYLPLQITLFGECVLSEDGALPSYHP